MLKLADVACTVHQHQQLPAEIVKNLKQTFKHPEPFVHVENKVKIRTGQHYKPEKPRNSWRTKYHRNVRQRSCGFYTPAHVPYQNVGEVVLDLKELVDGSLGSLRPKKNVWGKLRKKPKVSFTFSMKNCSLFYLVKGLIKQCILSDRIQLS